MKLLRFQGTIAWHQINGPVKSTDAQCVLSDDNPRAADQSVSAIRSHSRFLWQPSVMRANTANPLSSLAQDFDLHHRGSRSTQPIQLIFCLRLELILIKRKSIAISQGYENGKRGTNAGFNDSNTSEAGIGFL
ncbi:MAG: hypothetical protein HY298_27595 [Verrucomicrobia bacterium]|nr:hypothetical protein [Verrucomicrobiota bacterium]